MQEPVALDVPAASPAPHHDVVTAVRNALKLGLSLLATWVVSIGVRLVVVPRHFGPAPLAPLTFADAFAATYFFALNFGVETYILREISVRAEHAKDFVGDVFALRIVGSGLLLLGMDYYLRTQGEPLHTRQLVWAFAALQFFLFSGNTLAALLHASTRVDGLSVINVVSKLMWGVIVAVALWVDASIIWIPVAQAVGEAVRCVVLWVLARRHVGLRLRLGAGHLVPVLLAGLPFFLNGFVLNFYGRQAITMLNFMGMKEDVAYYGQAVALSQIIMLATPIVHWVLMPLFARSALRSAEVFREQVCRSVEWILALAFPVSLGLYLGADFFVHLLWGERFALSVEPLRLLAPVFVLTYVSTVGGILLIQRRRAYALVGISVMGLLVNRGLNMWLIPVFAARAPLGGASVGAAAALVLTEVVVAATMIGASARIAFDGRSLVSFAKTLAVCGAVLLLDGQLGALPSVLRLVVDMLVYAALLVLSGAFKPADAVNFARIAMARRKAEA